VVKDQKDNLESSFGCASMPSR